VVVQILLKTRIFLFFYMTTECVSGGGNTLQRETERDSERQRETKRDRERQRETEAGKAGGWDISTISFVHCFCDM
jgi:hypothetical protein